MTGKDYDFYQELLTYALARLNTDEQRETLREIIAAGVEAQCFCILQEIQRVVRDTTFDDPQCFARIEEIVSIFEKYRLDAGSRHDF